MIHRAADYGERDEVPELLNSKAAEGVTTTALLCPPYVPCIPARAGVARSN
jgi:hypothetical protein